MIGAIMPRGKNQRDDDDDTPSLRMEMDSDIDAEIEVEISQEEVEDIVMEAELSDKQHYTRQRSAKIDKDLKDSRAKAALEEPVASTSADADLIYSQNPADAAVTTREQERRQQQKEEKDAITTKELGEVLEHIKPPANKEENNIKSLRERGLRPNDHGYIRQPKTLRNPKSAWITVRRADNYQPLPTGLFQREIIEAIVGIAAGKVRCTVKQIVKVNQLSFIVATAQAGSLVGLCDELFKNTDWLGFKIKADATILGSRDTLTIFEALETREADLHLNLLLDPTGESPKKKALGSAPRHTRTEAEEEVREQKRRDLKMVWETKQFLRRPSSVVRASNLPKTTPDHVQCLNCSGYGHNHIHCPTRLLMTAMHNHPDGNLDQTQGVPMAQEQHGTIRERSTTNSNNATNPDGQADKPISVMDSILSTLSEQDVQPQRLNGGKPPKLPTFAGDATKDSVSFTQWVFEVRTHARNYSEAKMKEALVIALKGTAADIVRMMGREATIEAILDKLHSIYGTVGSYETMMRDFYNLDQKPGEDVAAFASRVETMCGTIHEHFPERLPRAATADTIRERFFKGLKERIKNSIRHKFDNITTTYLDLLQAARRAEQEFSAKSNNHAQENKAQNASAKKGGIINLRTNKASLSIPEEEQPEPEPEQEPLPGEDPVDRLSELEGQIAELRRAAFSTQGANGPARPAGVLRPSAPAFQPRAQQGYSRNNTGGYASGTSNYYQPKKEEQPKASSSEENKSDNLDINKLLSIVCHNCRGVGHMQSHCPTPFRVYLNGRVGSSAGGSPPEEPKSKAS